ncbi:type IX secretion system sortase PorU [Psychroserpens algicola]|uniref:Type IX secretion system sortase PorU n=1 Tax=Psychroserpens algicola TaxID=1719034 RepID=A0ABT0H6N1_9FLAO|nr:type IX secretion system sortase PorU [Psychroserpens algicola]MCK8479679.1 type IX secretion system sortase PorU [Psychroserpens algicola]
MKKHLLFSLLLISFFSFSQQKQFNIVWEGIKVLETETSKIEIPSFSTKHFSFLRSQGLKFYAEWEESSYLNENSIQLSQVAYQNISVSDLKDLPLSTIPNTPKVTLRNAIDRDKLNAYLEITPIINDRGIYKKITAFTIDYQYGGALNRTSLNNNEITNSVLNTGNWYKFYVDKSGVFRLSKSFLNALGVNTNVDPRTIKVFGNGGAMLPLANSEFYPSDLTENAIRFVGEEDGVFDDQDYILFYAEGPKEYNSESDTNINLFTDKSYYFINTDGGFGKRVTALNQPEGDISIEVNTFQDYQFHEVDENNLAKIGRRWLGERFDIENERNYTFSFPNLVSELPAKIRVLAGAVSESPSTNMQVVLNGTLVNTMGFTGINDPILASGNSFQDDVNLSSPEVSVNLIYNNNGNPSSSAYLDFISIEATRSLIFEGTQFKFKNNDVAINPGVAQYTIGNTSNVQEIWDISDKYNVKTIVNSDQSASMQFLDVAGESKTYITVSSLDYFDPSRDANTTVANQNIKGTIFLNSQGEFQDVDYIIVARNSYASQAERLAQINRDKYNLNVKVVTLNEIYNEFSSGNQDIAAIRNMVRYVYNNGSSPSRRLKYVCLFGDASYDYKDRVSNNTNIVPIWNSKESFSLTSSFISDDFYGMMDDNEGLMNAGDRLDIAVGRILADTPQRAVELVDKIEGYYAEEAFGSWRNNIIAISDDVNESWEEILQGTTDEISNEISTEKPFINAVKIHSDAFQQESSASGERYPQVNKAIKDAIEVGALVVNYFGHGGEDGLAAERVFTKFDAQEIRNVCKFNLFITITCEYTKFDNPQRQTAGEFTYWNKDGGSIALITTTRQIFVTAGISYNVVLEQFLFSYGSNEYPSVAEALRLTKNDPAISGNPQRSLVFYIGDPAMKLAFARPEIRLTAVNDVPIGEQTEVLKALDRVKMSGEVYDTAGNFLSNYNGILTATVFDKEIDRQTLGNDGTTGSNGLIILDFKTLGETMFKGQATVTNGKFDFEFVVPRDIGIPVGPGKVSFYAKQDNILDDKSGFNFDIQVGGINENAEEDNVGPVISLFMNDENFVSGGITNEQPTLLAKLQDENGINTASGIGHDIVAILDGDETNPFVLNDYYEANVDDYQSGKLSYLFRDLETGLHTLTLKAWDVYNNSSTAEIEFLVRDKDEELVIDNVLNYPNPFIDYTEFWFNHNSSDVLDVSVQIFTVSGKLVRTLNGQTSGGSKVTSSLSKDIVWDGRDDFGDKIGKGVYIYKLKVRSSRLNKQVEKIEKLVIL